MIEITPNLALDDSEIQLEFIRSAGPGGQNVNKVATAVQMRFNVSASPSLPDDVKVRLTQIAGSRMTSDGWLLIEAHRYRTQEQNRADAILRLTEMIRQAMHKPKPRKKTRPTLSSQAERVETKRKRGSVKRLRQSKSYDE